MGVKDTDTRLTVNNGDFTHDIQMKFMKPDSADYQVGDCTVIAGDNGSRGLPLDKGVYGNLLDELTAPVDGGFFTMEFLKRNLGLPSGDHLLLVERDGTFESGTHGNTRIMLGPTDDEVGVGPGTVTGGPDTFVFTGPVWVWAHGVGGGGGKRSDRIIACGGAGDNTVTATIDRSPA